MFGLEPDEAERLRRPRRLRAWVVLVELLVVLLLALPLVVLEALGDPTTVGILFGRVFQGPKFRMSVGDIVLLPPGDWRRPSTWALYVEDLRFAPRDPKKPSWRVDAATMALPERRRAAEGPVVHWSWLRVHTLVIEAHQQRPPPPWEPVEGAVAALTGDVVHIGSATFSAPEDPPLGASRVERIGGTVRDVVYRPGRREVSGVGGLHIDRFRSGAIDLRDLDLETVTLDRSTLRFGGTFEMAETLGTITGEIRTFHVKSDVLLHAQVRGLPLQEVIRTATGREAPLDGRVDAVFDIRAGGPLPRGGARMVGDLVLRDGRIQLDRRTRYVFLDLIRIAPWVELDARNQVVLRDLRGRVGLTRGTVRLEGLTYPAGRRALRLDGTIGGDDLHLFVRLMPPGVEGDGRLTPEDDRLGFGVVISGADQQRVRLATRPELISETPWRALTDTERDVLEEALREARRARWEARDPFEWLRPKRPRDGDDGG